jgi:hypothetical protein
MSREAGDVLVAVSSSGGSASRQPLIVHHHGRKSTSALVIDAEALGVVTDICVKRFRMPVIISGIFIVF